VSLLNTLLGSVINDKIADQISSITGMSPEQSKKAVAVAMPLLVSWLAKNASKSSQEAESIDHALDQHDGSMLDNLNVSDLLSNDDGQKIIGHILGSKTKQAETIIAKETGADNSQISTILKIAAPIVMNALSKEKKSQGLDLSGLTNLLGSEKNNIKSDNTIQSIIFDFIDQDDDGSVIDDVFSFASQMLQK